MNIEGNAKLGSKEGLEVWLYNNEKATKYHWDVFINNPGEKFHLGADGNQLFRFDIGSQNHILMKKQYCSHLGYPYSNCTENSMGEDKDMMFRGNYSQVIN